MAVSLITFLLHFFIDTASHVSEVEMCQTLNTTNLPRQMT